MITIAILVALAMAKTQGYNDPVKAEAEAEAEVELADAPKPQHYDEVLATDYKGNVYGASALYGTTKWNSWKLDYGKHKLYQPAGVAFCGGVNDNYGRWLYAYVADAGDAEHPGAVYQYKVVRDAKKPGHYELSGQEAIYGGAEMVGMKDVYGWGAKAAATEAPVNATEAPVEVDVKLAPAPVDVVCDQASGGLFINDNNHGQVVWNGNAKEDDNEAWVNKDCNNAVKGVQAGDKVGKWVYWATANKEVPEASGVYRQDVKNDAVECAEAVKEDDWLEKGGAVEKVADHKEGVWGVAVHNNQVLLAEDDTIYTAGTEEDGWQSPAAWSWDHGKVRKIASAADRGVVYADEDNDGVYVTKGKAENNKIADVPNAYGVAYYAGAEWVPEEADSASSVVFATAAAIVAAAAMF